jgi:Flp pilus assembly pilin Flp
MSIASAKLWKRLMREETGNEVIEYALLLGMIVCACIFFISALGKKVVGRWDRINDLFDV